MFAGDIHLLCAVDSKSKAEKWIVEDNKIVAIKLSAKFIKPNWKKTLTQVWIYLKAYENGSSKTFFSYGNSTRKRNKQHKTCAHLHFFDQCDKHLDFIVDWVLKVSWKDEVVSVLLTF